MTSIFNVPTSEIEEINVAITASTATTIVDATDDTRYVLWFEVNENNGSTPNLTVDVYDGTNARYLGSDANATYVALAVTAKLSVKFTQGYVVPKGSKIRVTSSDASGRFHVHGVMHRNT
jgi:flavin-binding protein dodecin